MDKKYFAERIGSPNQIAYARRSVLSDGKSEGMKIIDIKNLSGLSLTLLESRCLDIAELSFRGINMSFLAKSDLVSQQNLSSAKNYFNGNFHGGMLYTCGLENIGPSSYKNGETLPTHGSLSKTPAENVSSIVDWENKMITVSGRIKQAELFGENLILERKINVSLEDSVVYIQDKVVNCGFSDEDIMLLYHFNFGYPMLSENLRLDIDDKEVVPRDEEAKKGVDKWNTFETPTANRPEEVFYHNPNENSDSMVRVNLINTEIKIGAEVVFNKKQLPKLIQWKSMASGDYALGIEPSTSLVGGYEQEKKEGRVITLKPGEKRDFNLSLRFYQI